MPNKRKEYVMLLKICLIILGVTLGMSSCAATRQSNYDYAETNRHCMEELQLNCHTDEDRVDCPKGDMSDAWECSSQQLHDYTICQAMLGTCEDHREIDEMEHESELSAWYRKWFITGPIGVALGLVVGLAVGL
jgi:hypothetical protein